MTAIEQQKHRSNIPGSYAVLFFIPLDFTTSHIHNWVLFPLWSSCLVVSGAISNCPWCFCSSLLDTFRPGGWGAHLLVSYLFDFSYCSWFSRQEYWSRLPFPPPVDHIFSKLFTMTCLSWWPCTAWLIALLSYTSPFTMTSLWSMKGNPSYYHYKLSF